MPIVLIVPAGIFYYIVVKEMSYIFISLVLVSIIFFVIIFMSKRPADLSGNNEKLQVSQNKKKPCPICGSMLESGEKVTSHEYRGVASSVVHVFGCPHCYGDKSCLARVCPVCKKEMNRDDYLMGIMTRGEKKIHLKIRGCPLCAGK